jgi:DNA-binding transcriptional MerR regulator
VSRKLYSTVEVAKAARVLRSTLNYWIKTGKISAPPVRLRDNRAVRLWTHAQMKRIRALSGTFKSGPKKKARGKRRAMGRR